ncbi:MAG: hypothetical protein H6Q20_1222 [Bacteroidetes bacterium]|nr:hypothetical protein [Bacteroidota bacterium]
MKIKNLYTIFAGALLFIGLSCSTNKNTWSTRSYQALNTRYNVYFNGKTAYKEGLKNIALANKEDYSNIIPMYPISRHENAGSAISNMDRAIEKSRKAIKQHSIKKKPERNIKKWSDPAYKLWFNQEEFNPALKDAWLLLAQAEFHKGDFIGSVGTFTYIARHYSGNKDVVTNCQLWIARAYAEMGWLYESEEVLGKLKQADLSPANSVLFSSVNADMLLKKRQYKEAIPFLELAAKKEKDKLLKQRFNFLLAQLYMREGNNQEAYDAFTRVIKANPSYEMDFNARIYRAELDNKNVGAVRKELQKMLKNPNNKDYLDQIYYVLGKTYLQQRDTAKAIGFFKQSVEKSTRNGFDKAATLITLADLYYGKQQYIQAQPCYDDASKIITVEDDDYSRISKRAQTLGELVSQYEIYTLQDSLQTLAKMPESKRIELIGKMIENLKKEERKAEEALATKQQMELNNAGDEMLVPIGGFPSSGSDWYFYNAGLMKSGQSEFVKKWGKRKLEDNWRRASKSATLFSDDAAQAVSAQRGDVPQAAEGPDARAATGTATNIQSMEFYLRQIPVTEAQLAKSDSELATALYNMGMIYKDKVEDYPMAIKTFDEFERRFPTDERLEETYFQSYMVEIKNGNTDKAGLYKNKLLRSFPASRYAQVLSQPDYLSRMSRMYAEQDSLYSLTYKAYNESNFALVKRYTEYVQQRYPLSTLMPKFMFLNALSVGKTDKPDVFEKALSNVVEKYPESDVSAMSKDILALIKQGREATSGTSHGSLLARREEIVKKEEAFSETRMDFSTDKMQRHRLVFITSAGKTDVNTLLYNIAAYNFTRFMVKDFDLVLSQPDSTKSYISVTNFDSYNEAEWYVSSITADPSMGALLKRLNVAEIVISEQNYGLINYKSWDEYARFRQQYLSQGNSQGINPDLIAIRNMEPTSINGTVLVQNSVQSAVVRPEPASNKSTDTAVKTDSRPAQQQVKPIEMPAEVKPQPMAEARQEPAQQSGAVVTTIPARTETPQAQTQSQTQPQVAPAVVVPKEDKVPLFKNLFAYRANEPHYVAVVVMSGTFDFDKLKAAFDTYNAQNYGMLNVKVSQEVYDKQRIVLIGTFADANIAKSYLMRMVKEKILSENLKGTDYRNVLGSQKNLQLMMQQNAMKTYFEFMQQYYLK